MWWRPTRDAFVPIVNSVVPISGLGRLSHNKLRELEVCVDALLLKVQLYIQNTPPELVPRVLGPTVQMIKHSLARIKSIAMVFRQVEFQVRDVQRFWLETVAMISYMEVYRPRMDATQGKIIVDIPPTADTLGVFTSDARVAQDHFEAGLPCWFIRPASAFNDQNILEVCQLELPYDLDLEPHPLRRTVLAKGRAGTTEKFDVIHRYARNIVKFSDPFNLGTTVNINAVVVPSLDTPQIAESSSAPRSMQQAGGSWGRGGIRGAWGGRAGRGHGNKQGKFFME